MSFLPKVGSTYSSIAAVKLDVLRRALPYGLKFGTTCSKADRMIEYRCSIRTRDRELCTCRIYAIKNEDGLFEVTVAEEAHTCHKRDRRLPPERSLLHPRRKIRVLKREVRALEKKKMVEVEDMEEESEEESWSNVDESEEDVSIRTRPPLLRSQIKRKDDRVGRQASSRSERSTEEETTGGEEDSDWTDDEAETRAKCQSLEKSRRTLAAPSSDARLLYPGSRDVSIEVSRLLLSGTIRSPSFEDGFDSSRQLLIRLYAYASQRGFTLYRKSGADESSWVQMVCSRYHSRWRNEPNGRCKFAIEARIDKRGQWRVSRVDGHHNHSTDSLTSRRHRVSESRLSEEEEEEAVVEVESRSHSHKRKRPASPPLPLPRPSPHDTFLVPRIPTRQRPTSIQRPRLTAATSSSSSSHSTEFSSILRSFLPQSSAQLSLSLTVLASLGIDNIDTLTSILLMDEKVFAKVLSEIEDDGTRNLLVTMATDLKSSK